MVCLIVIPFLQHPGPDPAIHTNYTFTLTVYTVTQTAPFQTINLTIDLVVSMELIKQVAFSAKLSKSSEADIVLKERGFTQS